MTAETTEPEPAPLASWDRKRCMEINRPGATEPELWVPLDLFVEVQTERDDFRRALALINAWRVGGMESISTLVHLLRGVGFDFEDGRAILGLIRWSREQKQTTDPALAAPLSARGPSTEETK